MQDPPPQIDETDDHLSLPEPAAFTSETSEDSSSKKRKRVKLFCFHCNRPEGHANQFLGAWFYSYFIGVTFGLLHFFGPFRCQCCGRSRLMFRNWLNPKFHAVNARRRAASTSSRSGRR